VPSLGGGIISNGARDYLERDAAFRATWDFGGGFGDFIETAIDDSNADVLRLGVRVRY